MRIDQQTESYSVDDHLRVCESHTHADHGKGIVVGSQNQQFKIPFGIREVIELELCGYTCVRHMNYFSDGR